MVLLILIDVKLFSQYKWFLCVSDWMLKFEKDDIKEKMVWEAVCYLTYYDLLPQAFII